jgi:hypothetical protein
MVRTPDIFLYAIESCDFGPRCRKIVSACFTVIILMETAKMLCSQRIKAAYRRKLCVVCHAAVESSPVIKTHLAHRGLCHKLTYPHCP